MQVWKVSFQETWALIRFIEVCKNLLDLFTRNRQLRQRNKGTPDDGSKRIK